MIDKNDEMESITEKYKTYPLYTTREEKELSYFDKVALLLFGSFFRKRRDKFKNFRITLKQARITKGYDLYLSRVLLLGVILTIVSMGISLLVASLIFNIIPIGLSDIGITFGKGPSSQISKINNIIRDIGVGAITILLFLVFFIIFTVIPTSISYLNPWYIASEREREIDTILPYTVTFMYALSRGGANFLNILKKASESNDVYGEAAEEFKFIIRDVEYFDTDLRTALENTVKITPSTDFQDFIQDIISIINTGGEIEDFLYDKTEEYLIEARRNQENFLETLSLMGEIYVTAFVAGPLFVIIIITVMALIGGSSIRLMAVVVYGVLPLANIGFMFLVDVVKSSKDTQSVIDEKISLTLSELKNYIEITPNVDEEIKSLYKRKKWRERKKLILNPLQTFEHHPIWTTVITIPVTLIYLVAIYEIYGIKEPVVKHSTTLTALYFVAPIFLILIPISIFHEKRARKKDRIVSQIPSMLNKLSSANATGMSLEESFGVVAKSTGGEIGRELSKVQNEIEWRGDLNEALIRFAKRIETSRLSRTIKLISQASMSTGDIAKVIDVAAKDVIQNHRLEKDRKQEMGMYTVIIVVAFLVYLLVIVMLNEAFLSRIASITEKTKVSEEFSGTAGFNISDLPVELYNMIFYHSSIIQAFGAGIVAGQMSSDRILDGLKYSVILTGVATAVFLLI